VEALVGDELKVFNDVVEYGVPLERKDGKFVQRKSPGISYPRMLNVIGGGHALTLGLKREIARHNIKVLEDMLITKLFASNNKVLGAIGLDLKKGKVFIVEAKSIVLATGGGGQLWRHSDCPPESKGDGYALGYYAGAELIDMEQQLFYPTVAVFPTPIYGLEISYEWCLHNKTGGWLINNKGERFFPPDTLPTRDISARRIFEEILSGKGTEHGGVYLDITKCNDARKKELFVAGMAHCDKRMLEVGIDLRKQLIEIAPGAHTTLGGIRINERGETSVSGLYAAGEVSANVHGANRIAGHAYLEILVFGSIAGRNAANFAKGKGWDPIPIAEAEAECQYIYGLLSGNKEGLRPHEIEDKIKHIVTQYVGPKRNRQGLETALEKVAAIKKEDLPRLSVIDIPEYNNEWIDALTVKSMVNVAEIVATSALLREESRGTHFREDFPEIDNKKGLKHTSVKLQNGSMISRSVPVIMSKIKEVEG
jgi:fumarate reductase (CoM/CoB) subunit A